jgi:hypothetical protein
MSKNILKKIPDWELRIGLIFFAPVIFAIGGLYAVYKIFKEFWNAE